MDTLLQRHETLNTVCLSVSNYQNLCLFLLHRVWDTKSPVCARVEVLQNTDTSPCGCQCFCFGGSTCLVLTRQWHKHDTHSDLWPLSPCSLFSQTFGTISGNSTVESVLLCACMCVCVEFGQWPCSCTENTVKMGRFQETRTTSFLSEIKKNEVQPLTLGILIEI